MTSALTPLKSDRFGLAQSGTALHLRRQGTRLPRRHVSSWRRAPKARGSRGEDSTRRVVDQRGIPGLRRGHLHAETGDREFSASLARRRGSGFWSRFLSLRFPAATRELGMVLDRPNTSQGHGYLGSATKTGIRRAARSWYSA